MSVLIASVALQIAVVGGLMRWGFMKDRRLRRQHPERYQQGDESNVAR